MRIKIDQSEKDQQWYIRFEGNNGAAFAASEGFTRDEDALRSANDFFVSAAAGITYKITDRNNVTIQEGGIGFVGPDQT